MSGHKKNICFSVHGYPSWHRLFGKPKSHVKTGHACNVITESVDHNSTTNVHDS